MRTVPVTEYFQVIDKGFDTINRSAQLFLVQNSKRKHTVRNKQVCSKASKQKTPSESKDQMKYQVCRNMMLNQFRKAVSTSIQFFTEVNTKEIVYQQICVPIISESDYKLSQ
jgi:hypothetical protein